MESGRLAPRVTGQAGWLLTGSEGGLGMGTLPCGREGATTGKGGRMRIAAARKTRVASFRHSCLGFTTLSPIPSTHQTPHWQWRTRPCGNGTPGGTVLRGKGVRGERATAKQKGTLECARAPLSLSSSLSRTLGAGRARQAGPRAMERRAISCVASAWRGARG